MQECISYLAGFVYYYPLLMSYVWMTGGLIFYWKTERKAVAAPDPDGYGPFSILIPCHNEERLVRQTVESLLGLDYPDYEIVLVDDGSTDSTAKVLGELCSAHERVRALYLKKNMGKGAALNYGVLMCRGRYVLTLDADALLDREALKWMAWHFEGYPRVGAITGNPRVLNRTTLLGKVQTGEYSTIIGLIKRSQRVIGKILTVSGVVAAFRKDAILSVGLWDTTMVTDDIDITWKLQRHFWEVRYEPRAVCWIFVPETIKGLWRQRLRWAQGGIEVCLKHWRVWLDWKQHRLWPIYFEYALSTAWSYLLWILLAVEAGLFAFGYDLHDEALPVTEELWLGVIPIMTCVTQFGLSLYMDRRYDNKLFRHLAWVVWYPVIYWFIIASTVIVAVPKALLRKKGPAVWTSPDRGLDKI